MRGDRETHTELIVHAGMYLLARRKEKKIDRLMIAESPKYSKRKRNCLGIRNSALINGFSILPRVWLTLDMDMGYRFI